MPLFIPVVAFCATLSAGEVLPIAPYECVWVENSAVTVAEECVPAVNMIINNEAVIARADAALLEEFQHDGVFRYFGFCVDSRDLKSFYIDYRVDVQGLGEDT